MSEEHMHCWHVYARQTSSAARTTELRCCWCSEFTTTHQVQAPLAGHGRWAPPTWVDAP